MTTDFPTGIDSFPDEADLTAVQMDGSDGFDHPAAHDKLGQAIAAVETKVGVNGSAVSASHDFKIAGLTTGLAALTTTVGGLTGAAAYPSVNLVRFVSPSGDDANDGLSPGTPKLTISAAYSNLSTVAAASYTTGTGIRGVGIINLAPGDYDVGTGLTFTDSAPVELRGAPVGAHSWDLKNSSSRIYSTSAAVTSLIHVGGTGTSAHGFTFREVAFLIDSTTNTLLTKCLYLAGLDNVTVERCAFNTKNNTTQVAASAIYAESHGDQAWWRIKDNTYANMQFLNVPAGTNINRWRVADNVGFFNGGGASMPHYNLAGDVFESVFDMNNCEGPATAFSIASNNADRNTFIGNAGESPNNTNPFYDLTASVQGCIFIGGFCNCLDGTTGTWIQFGTNAYNNQVIGSFDTAGQAGFKAKYIDNSTNGNQIWHGNTGLNTKYKSGTSPTISDSDFTSTPPNGTRGTTYNTSSGKTLLWARANGTWHSLDTSVGSSSLVTDMLATFLLPSGAAAANLPRVLANAEDLTTITSGTLFLSAIELPTATTLSTITFVSAATGANTPTHQWFGLFDNTRAPLALTADDTTTAWATNAQKTLSFATDASGNPISNFTTTYAGLHYVGILVTASVAPHLRGKGMSATTLANIAPIINGTSTAALTTPASCPNPAGAITATTNVPYFYVG